MDVEPETAAASHEHDGQTYYFCCDSCLEKFRAEPEKYLERSGSDSPGRPKPSQAQGGLYTCPMDPEIRQPGPAPCPKCGMALEPLDPMAAMTTTIRTEYVCPMHPEIVRSEPGSCPICGMALEPRTVTIEGTANPELIDMSRRFWIGLSLTLPLLLLTMIPMFHTTSSSLLAWFELAFATPVVVWGGWPFFQRGWASIANRSLNMFTLIAIGTGTAYLYSIAATIFPGLFPDSFRSHNGEVGATLRRGGGHRCWCCWARCEPAPGGPATRLRLFWGCPRKLPG
jgi:Cu+-exporting ATPase